MKGILIAVFGGLFGGYRFYKKQPLMGVLYLCTAGLYFVGWIIDMSSAYREYFESKSPTSELSTKTSGAKTKGIIAAILSFTILCGGLGVAGVFLPETESSSSSSSSGESYGHCVSCGKRTAKSRLYSGFCGSCYSKWKDADF